MSPYRFKFATILMLLGLAILACSPAFLAQRAAGPTATPTKTPTSPFTATPTPAPATATPTPTPTPSPTNTPIPMDTETSTPEPTATPLPAQPTVADTPVPAEPSPMPVPAEPTATPAPEFAYKIVHYKVLGDGENNGGIFNKGGQHLIFLTVLDANGNGIDGAIVKDANGSNLEVVTGSKGPGKAEIEMLFQPFKLYVAADPSGPTTSEVSHQMNTEYPDISDVVGKLGSIDNEYSVCPTAEIRCTPPFYNVHFSYEITFQKVN